MADATAPYTRLLSGGDPRALHNVDLAVTQVLADPAEVESLFESVFAEDEVVRMRAADALEKVCAERPDLLTALVPRMLTEMAGVDQPSVQWHLAQILGVVDLDESEQESATELLFSYLERSDDWIVANHTLATLAVFARRDPLLRGRFRAALVAREHSRHKSVANRVRKLLAEFG